MSLPMVVFPHPDSPTRPNVDPTGTAKDTSATAETCPTFRCSTAPAVTVKFFTSRETVSSGASTAPSGDGATSGRRSGSLTNGVDGSRTSSLDPTG